MATQKFDVSDEGVATLVRDVLTREKSRAEGQASYLRTLIAATQIELGSQPKMGGRGRVKPVEVAEAMKAINVTHGRFYAIVLAQLEAEPDAKERNSQSGFARSAVSTFRSAVRLGLNPLEIVIPTVSKGWLREWTRAHRAEAIGPMSVSAAQRSARALVKRLAALIEPMSDEAKAEVLTAFHADVDALDVTVNYDPQERFTKSHVIPTRPRLRQPAGTRAAA